MKNISWNDYKIAYQVALDGSLSQAGKSLNINHATVLRRINQLEDALNVKLFFRHQRGYQLTDAGNVLIEEMPAVLAQFNRLENQLQHVEDHLRGELRISTVSAFSIILAPVLKLFRAKYPDILITLISTDDIVPLETGSAHVSLRVGPKPDSGDLIVKELAEYSTRYYAHNDYIAEYGLPTKPEEFAQHLWAMPMQDKYRIPFIRYVTDQLKRENIVFQSNHFPDIAQAVISGVAIGPVSVQQARSYPNITYVPLDLPSADGKVWFVQHKDLKENARVRCLYDFLASHL